MFEDLFEDILDEEETGKKEEEDEGFHESKNFELFHDDETQNEPDVWFTRNVNMDDTDIWSTDEVWNTAD